MSQFGSLVGRLYISDKAHLNLSFHALIDQAKERLKGEKAIGTTGKGIGILLVGDESAKVGTTIELLEKNHRYITDELLVIKRVY